MRHSQPIKYWFCCAFTFLPSPSVLCTECWENSWKKEEHLVVVVMAVLGSTDTWKWNENLVWKCGKQSSPPFPTTVNQPLPLLSQYGLGCCSGSGIAEASQCLHLLVTLEHCHTLSWCRQWKDNCIFFNSFYFHKSRRELPGTKKRHFCSPGVFFLLSITDLLHEWTSEGSSKAFIAENVRQAKWLPVLLCGNTYRWESVSICNAIHIWEGMFMEIDWRRRQRVEKRNFVRGKYFFFHFKNLEP